MTLRIDCPEKRSRSCVLAPNPIRRSTCSSVRSPLGMATFLVKGTDDSSAARVVRKWQILCWTCQKCNRPLFALRPVDPSRDDKLRVAPSPVEGREPQGRPEPRSKDEGLRVE